MSSAQPFVQVTLICDEEGTRWELQFLMSNSATKVGVQYHLDKTCSPFRLFKGVNCRCEALPTSG